jgi:hypothetical protein
MGSRSAAHFYLNPQLAFTVLLLVPSEAGALSLQFCLDALIQGVLISLS